MKPIEYAPCHNSQKNLFYMDKNASPPSLINYQPGSVPVGKLKAGGGTEVGRADGTEKSARNAKLLSSSVTGKHHTYIQQNSPHIYRMQFGQGQICTAMMHRLSKVLKVNLKKTQKCGPGADMLYSHLPSCADTALAYFKFQLKVHSCIVSTGTGLP